MSFYARYADLAKMPPILGSIFVTMALLEIIRRYCSAKKDYLEVVNFTNLPLLSNVILA